MTDDELRVWVANLAEDSQRIHEAQMETRKLLELNAIAQRATDEQMKRTDEQMKRTDEKLERVGIKVGNIGQNQGAVAEEFFYNSVKDSQVLAGVHYDFIDKNISRTCNGISDEFDMILVNGKDVAIVEVKYKAHNDDLTKLITKKYNNFKALFPAYKEYRHHLVLATFHIYDELKELALQNNVIVLQRKGDVVESFLPN